MKRSIIVFVIAALVILTTGLWIYTAGNKLNPVDIVQFGVIIIVVGFAVYVGFRRLGSEKRGEPTEDERSKLVLQRTAAISYYISLYIWVFILFIRERVSIDIEELIGSGILGMALTFGIVWFVVNSRGVRNG